MSDQSLVDKIRSETYLLNIWEAFKGDSNDITMVSTKLIEFITNVYRSFEPDHFKGTLVVFTSLDNSEPLPLSEGKQIYDLNALMTIESGNLILQYYLNGNLPKMWQKADLAAVYARGFLSYTYKNKSEHFTANGVQIPVSNKFGSPSIYALSYYYLTSALDVYKQDKIKFSSCSIFEDCWFDKSSRLFFRKKPEDQMQLSLKEFLSSSLRHIDIVREYTLGASKPVDIRVYWKNANRAALIEVKWLGASKATKTKISTKYSNGRVIEGLTQLKNYMDLENQDTPSCITKGFLVVIDGRRRGLKPKTTKINSKDGLHFLDKEFQVNPPHQYHRTIRGFEPPIRMFAEPICS